MRQKAFTLIELLVVVAIIAILAAIAVPNFLEAMTRAKVVKTKSDLRTITTALEVYRIDTNHYPPDVSDGVKTFMGRMKNLTTPVAYITSAPADPFADFAKIKEYCQAAAKLTNPYTADGSLTGAPVFPLTYDFSCRFNFNGTQESLTTWARIAHDPTSVVWAMRGIGPDRWATWLGDLGAAYDPTNGSVSRGEIFWTGPGKGEDQPLIGG